MLVCCRGSGSGSSAVGRCKVPVQPSARFEECPLQTSRRRSAALRVASMKLTALPPISLALIVLATQVGARPGYSPAPSHSPSRTARSRHSRQDLRMLPANSTGTPQDQALAGGLVPPDGMATAGSSSPTPRSMPRSTPISASTAPGAGPTGAFSPPRASDSRRGTGPMYSAGSPAQERTVSHPGPAADFSGEDSNIVFPTPPIKVELPLNDPKFDPFARAPSRVAPACAKGSTFCTDVDNYPENYLQTMLRSASLGFKEYFGNDVIAEGNITQRIDASDENPLCPYEETVVYPKVAKNKEDKWLYVVNQDHFVQGVRIETCLNPGTPCQLAENFPYGYTTSCRQKYILRKLVALNPEGQTQTDMFRLPSCCSCHVIRSNVSSRRSNMSPAIKKQGSRKR